MEDENTNVETVEVSFVTKLPSQELVVDNKPFRVPQNLGRYGLSQIINHLLSLEPQKPFDFLIDDQFLRTNLAEYIQNNNLSEENTLTIEYTLALSPPNVDDEKKTEDWISTIEEFHMKGQKYLVTGSYDKTLRIWQEKYEGSKLTIDQKQVVSGHASSVTRVLPVQGPGNTTSHFISSSKDQTVRIWKNEGEITTSHIGIGHLGSVVSLSMVSKEHKATSGLEFCSGSFDGAIYLWNSSKNELSKEDVEKDSSVAPAVKKLKKDSKQFVTYFKPYLQLNASTSGDMQRAHGQAVSGLEWPSEQEIYSASWDHTVKKWDAGAGLCSSTLYGPSVIHCMKYNPKSQMIVTGHSDNHLRLWDFRVNSSNESVVKNTYKSHKGWIMSVCWKPDHDYLFASASVDGTVKLWDVRSLIPIQTIENLHQKEQVLSLLWQSSSSSDSHIISAGADSRLVVSHLPASI